MKWLLLIFGLSDDLLEKATLLALPSVLHSSIHFRSWYWLISNSQINILPLFPFLVTQKSVCVEIDRPIYVKKEQIGKIYGLINWLCSRKNEDVSSVENQNKIIYCHCSLTNVSCTRTVANWVLFPHQSFIIPFCFFIDFSFCFVRRNKCFHKRNSFFPHTQNANLKHGILKISFIEGKENTIKTKHSVCKQLLLFRAEKKRIFIQ